MKKIYQHNYFIRNFIKSKHLNIKHENQFINKPFPDKGLSFAAFMVVPDSSLPFW